MQAILPIHIEASRGNDARLITSNMILTMAHSPRALEGYVQLKSALHRGKLSVNLREQIALAVAQINLCEYSLAEHAHYAARLGMTHEQIAASREARAMDWGSDAVLRFARDLAARRGECSLAELRESGFSDADIVEVVAHVALNIFENYLNDVALTELDFPRIARSVRAA